MDEASPSPSPLGIFGNLPPEVRNEIYKHALTSSNPIEISRYRHNREKPAQKNEHPPNTRRVGAYKHPGPLPPRPHRRIPATATIEPTQRTNKCDYGPRSRIVVWRGKQKRKLSAARVLAIGLLRTSKVIFTEAASSLYGGNHFDFENDFAVDAFMDLVDARAALLTCVTIPAKGPYGGDNHIRALKVMANPQRIIINVPKVSVEMSAALVKHRIEDIFLTQLCYDIPGEDPTRGVLVELPDELWLRRFEAAEFRVPPEVPFVIEGRKEVVEDDGERGRMFKDVLREAFLNGKKRGRAIEELRGRIVEEKVRASRALRPL